MQLAPPLPFLAVATDKGYFSPSERACEGHAPLVANSRRRLGSGEDHSYFVCRRFESCHASERLRVAQLVEQLNTVIANSLHGLASPAFFGRGVEFGYFWVT